MPLKARAERERGSVLIGALVLIALLFFIETALAAAVSSTLHSIRVVDSQAGVRYAAESAAARGIASGEVSQACPASAFVNGITATTTCFTLGGIQASPASVQQWSAAAQTLGAGGCAVTSLPASAASSDEGAGSITLWTVLAWRGAGGSNAGLTVWIDNASTCTQQSGLCPGATGQASPPLSLSAPGVANFLAVTCADGDSQFYLHVKNGSGTVDVSPFFVRGSLQGSDTAVVAVGAAGTELDEAEVLLPATSSGTMPTQDLWDTLLR